MKATTFYSNRVHRNVAVVLTHDKVHYIMENDTAFTIDRDTAWHLNDDGVDRAVLWFEDPRFNL